MKRLKRLSVAMVLVLAALTLPLGGQASTGSQPKNPPTPIRKAQVDRDLQADAAKYAQLKADLAAARPFISIDSNGFFTVSSAYQPRQGGLDARASLAVVNAGLKSYQGGQQRSEFVRAIGAQINAGAYWCTYIPFWALMAYAWYLTAAGGITAGVGAALGITIIGIPATIILVAMGAGTAVYGQFLVWYFDKYYPNGYWFCN